MLFAARISLPLVFQFLSECSTFSAEFNWSYLSSLRFSLWMMVSHALAFELVTLLFALVHLGVLTHATLKKSRRGAIVAIFILAAIFTPPDVLSQLLLAFPLILFYEGVIFYAKTRGKKTKGGINLHLNS